jgi:hypothetical protein
MEAQHLYCADALGWTTDHMVGLICRFGTLVLPHTAGFLLRQLTLIGAANHAACQV